jgi:hypothetical protein
MLTSSSFSIQTDLTGLNRHVTKYYLRQNEIIESFKQIGLSSKQILFLRLFNCLYVKSIDSIQKNQRLMSDESQHWSIAAVIYASFALNIVLLCAKVFATILSGSLAVLAS